MYLYDVLKQKHVIEIEEIRLLPNTFSTITYTCIDLKITQIIQESPSQMSEFLIMQTQNFQTWHKILINSDKTPIMGWLL